MIQWHGYNNRQITQLSPALDSLASRQSTAILRFPKAPIMAKMSMIDHRLLQMQLEAMQAIRILLLEKAFTVMQDQ